MKQFPELKPTKYDALVVLAVLLIAAAAGARYWIAPARSAAEVVVSIDGAEAERLPLAAAERSYTNRGYTVHLVVDNGGAWVDDADCPTRDCVRTGKIARAGQSVVCLPARVVVTIEGAEQNSASYDADQNSASYDAIAG
ncbi:MAG: NusG domain II-containing protein [Oscillospiraceae bacterium]|nr:NusG domain II-containing protein [Oscillospiraceae bacterium]